MTGPDYAKAIKKLFGGLMIGAPSRFFGIGKSTADRWLRDGTPYPVEILIRLMIALKLSPDDVNRIIGREQDK